MVQFLLFLRAVLQTVWTAASSLPRGFRVIGGKKTMKFRETGEAHDFKGRWESEFWLLGRRAAQVVDCGLTCNGRRGRERREVRESGGPRRGGDGGPRWVWKVKRKIMIYKR